MEQKMLVATSNMGLGLWTSICFIVGKESKIYKNKQNGVCNAAKYRLKNLIID